ncbi:hypothetical protein F5Y18DRAFT_422831 [Xylariaceae sp. FL1019]|nr:hypothetical protein F5Y18DRAFT_422831 [Xylariaceae sp. FL1019]
MAPLGEIPVPPLRLMTPLFPLDSAWEHDKHLRCPPLHPVHDHISFRYTPTPATTTIPAALTHFLQLRTTDSQSLSSPNLRFILTLPSYDNMDRTDEELDRDWQPSGRRPQSTIARSFSAELMDIFRIENSVADLDEQVNKRKQQVTSGQSEIQALEARIKEMEDRLKSGKVGSATNSPRTQRQPLSSTFGQQPQGQSTEKAIPQRPLQTSTSTSSRPGTAKQAHAAPHGGAMPPTPTASEGEFQSDLVNSSSSDRNGDARSFADYVMVTKDGDDRDS